jgi:hypothetical protein
MRRLAIFLEKQNQVTALHAAARSSHSSAMESIFAFDAGLWA